MQSPASSPDDPGRACALADAVALELARAVAPVCPACVSWRCLSLVWLVIVSAPVVPLAAAVVIGVAVCNPASSHAASIAGGRKAAAIRRFFVLGLIIVFSPGIERLQWTW